MTTVPQLISRQSQPQGQCQERLMQPSRLPPPPPGQYTYAQLDSNETPFNPDEDSPGSPRMKAVHPKLELTESPPPDIPIARVSLPPNDGNAKSNRPKIQPVSGDAVLVAYLGNGRHPEIAQAASHQALAGGDDFENTDDDDSQKSLPQDAKHLSAADIVQRPQTAASDGTHLRAFATSALAASGVLGSSYHGPDKPGSDLTASTCQLSLHDDVLPSPNHHVKSPSILGGRHSAADNGSQSLLSPESGELAPLQIDSPKSDSNSGQSISLPSLTATLLNIERQFTAEMPTSGDRDLSMRPPGDARTFSRSSNVGVSRFQSMPAGGRVSPPISPSEAYQRSFPSPNSLPASSPYGLASNGSSHRSPAEYLNNTSNKSLQSGYALASPPTAMASVADRMSIDGITNPQVGGYKCTFDGCTAPPFQTQYLLNSHANVHSSARPHYCPVKGCPRAEGGKGFKRKNEMIRHGLVHDSPGYVCPFCADREHKYPRPDNLQRYVHCHRLHILMYLITHLQT
jgi:hypothetical protein